MGVGEPGPAEAHAALAEAAAARMEVAGSDRGFAPRLLALAAGTVFLAALITLFTALPAWTGPVQGVMIGLGIAFAAGLVVLTSRRQRAYTPFANRLFVGVLLIWIFWGEIVLQFSFHSDWLDVRLPLLVKGLHLMISAAVAVVPLLGGALLFWRRR